MMGLQKGQKSFKMGLVV